ncbi:MAG TPA: hypothetical protein VGR02_12015 [Thermoanaerobaculia bacterium]|jgi:hypothetical protein|nr:hypothetical protein [Thermoanaerobaculia bacterium]
MATLRVSFVGIMCHYDMADPDRPKKKETDPFRRTIVVNATNLEHPHQAFLAVPHDKVLSDIGWPKPVKCTIDGSPFQRYDLDGVRMRVLSGPDDLEDSAPDPSSFLVDPTFTTFVPPLGQVIQNFKPIDPDYVEYNESNPDLVAAHFDMRAGRLHVAEFDSFASFFNPSLSFPPGGRIPLASRVRLDIEVDPTGGIVIVGEFYKAPNRPKRRLILDPGVRRILIGNVVPADIAMLDEGASEPADHAAHGGAAVGSRAGHFEIYSRLSKNFRNNAATRVGSTQLLPQTPAPDDRPARGMSGGCPGTNYPP